MEFPENITIEYIKSIDDFKILKKLVTHKGWGGKGGYFILRDIKQQDLEVCKEKAIKILGDEIKASKFDNELDKSLALGEEFIENSITYIKDKKGFLIDVKNKIVKVPARNNKKQFVGYCIVSIESYEKVIKHTYHIRIDRHGYKSFVSHRTSLEKIILDDIPENYKVTHKNNDSLDYRLENLAIVTPAQFEQAKLKTKGKFSSDYKGVNIRKEENKTIYRSFITVEDKYINIGNFSSEIEAAKAYDHYAFHYYKEHCGHNNLLSQEEIENVLKNGIPEKYKKEKIDRGLPKNILFTNNNYVYSFTLRGKKYYKNFGKDLQKAIDEMNQKIKELNKNYKNYEKKRNIKIEKGVVTLSIYGKYNEKDVEILFDENIWNDIKKYSFYLSDSSYVFSYINNKNIAIHVYLYKKYIEIINKDTTIDHININPLDNRLENLRAATFSLQNHNRKKNEDSIIKNIKGVTINGNKFVVNPYGKRFSFKYLEDASQKFNELAKEKYGDDAKLNPPMKTEKTEVIDILDVEDIDEEYIKNITHVELFKLVVKKKKWGGQKGKIHQTKVKAGNLKEYKQIAINLLMEESK